MRCPSRKGLAKRQWHCTCSCGDPGTAWGAPGSAWVPEMAGKMGKLVRKRGFRWLYMVLHGLIGIILRLYWDYNGKNKQYWGFTGIGWRKLLTEKSMVFQMKYHVLFQFNEQCGTCKFWDKPTCGTARVIPWHPQIGGGAMMSQVGAEYGLKADLEVMNSL